MRRINTPIKSLIVCLTFAATISCTLFDDPEALREAKAKISFREAATYTHRALGSRGKRYSRRHKVILLEQRLNAGEMEFLAHKLHRAYPDTSIDFFDEGSQLQEYVEWDEQDNDWHNGKTSYGNLPLRLKEYVRRHRIAKIKLCKDYDKNYKWFLENNDGTHLAAL